MRKAIAIAFVISMQSLVGYGQLENIPLNDYTTANKLYAGFYSKLHVPIDSLRTSANASLRLGALITQRYTNVFLLEAPFYCTPSPSTVLLDRPRRGQLLITFREKGRATAPKGLTLSMCRFINNTPHT